MAFKNIFTSLTTLLNGRVLYPEVDFIVFPCIGSHDQITFKPSFFIALINLGKNLPTFS